jgi:hypothetical protein
VTTRAFFLNDSLYTFYLMLYLPLDALHDTSDHILFWSLHTSVYIHAGTLYITTVDHPFDENPY